MTEALQTALLATTNFDWIDQDERPLQISHDGVLPEDSGRYFKNIADIFFGKTTYFGCAMAFRRELIPLILPIPTTSSRTTGGLRWPATSPDPTFT